ncbi:MAG: hypothetical protein K6C08_09715 [Oscillospiraceae bacterium]|nr:hypothetical protein [Oscillospiraceae bacterium]
MKNSKTTALLMLLVFLLVAAVVIIFLTGLDSSAKRNNTPENVTSVGDSSPNAETPAPSASPTPSAVILPTTAPTYYPPSTTAPAATVRPVTTATPKPTATPTPTPTPSASAGSGMLPAAELIPATPTPEGNGTTVLTPLTVLPTGTTLGSGTFRSETGASINIHADWTAVVSGEKTVDITVTAYVDSYSLFTTASPETLNISLDGQYVSLASPAIEYDGNTQITTQINSRTFTVNLSAGEIRSLPLQVAWMYRGTYGGMQIDVIECGGTITVSR